MFKLKIFVRVQTFRRGPPVPPRNFCHPGKIHGTWLIIRWLLTCCVLLSYQRTGQPSLKEMISFICKRLPSLQTADPSGWPTTFAQICDKWSESFTRKYFCVILQSLCPVKVKQIVHTGQPSLNRLACAKDKYHLQKNPFSIDRPHCKKPAHQDGQYDFQKNVLDGQDHLQKNCVVPWITVFCCVNDMEHDLTPAATIYQKCIEHRSISLSLLQSFFISEFILL